MASTPCQICGTKDQLYLCSWCIGNLQHELDQVPQLLQELRSLIESPVQNAYRLKFGNETSDYESRPPLRLELTEAQERLRELPGWAEIPARGSQAREDTVSCLGDISRARRLLADAPELRIWGTCDTPDCDHRLIAPTDHKVTRCPSCGWRKHWSDLIEKRIQEFDKYPAPPRQVREAVESLAGVKVSKKTFENWVYHRKLRYVLDTVGTGNKERRLYFMRDLLLVYQSLNVVP